MLPVEHPEFFRRPPPPGQSRESSIRLDADGRFWHAGELVRHPGMQAAFATWIRRHPDYEDLVPEAHRNLLEERR